VSVHGQFTIHEIVHVGITAKLQEWKYGMKAGMRVLLSNNTGPIAKHLLAKYPDQIGHCISPGGWRKPFPYYVAENGRFNSGWSEDVYFKHLEKVSEHPIAPQWLSVLDVVGDHAKTLAEWKMWYGELRNYGWPLAFVAQDGCEPSDVPKEAEVVFIGGTTTWKRRNIYKFCDYFPRVHVGRINTAKWLKVCHDAGAESVDGTGWFRGDRVQLSWLVKFLEGEHSPNPRPLLDKLNTESE